ncbi:MAG TPA: inorganic diphosphatase, partial [Bacteroidia bacterium]|nr:inorganic diphosphatase [Bacteroidia bacterium]
CVNVIIETPYKSRNKFDYDKETGLFKFHKVIPTGMEFPCEMGFIPHTEGEDGDPLDALVLMDELTYPGCLVECRLLGVLKAIQKEKGKKEVRNDRFIFVPANMKEYNHLKKIEDLNQEKVHAIAFFFENYNKEEGRKFIFKGIGDVKEAHKLIKKQLSK